jgi:RNA polymerase sigma factor (sigma-70 family)
VTRERPRRREILVAPRDLESMAQSTAASAESERDGLHLELLDILRDLVSTALTDRQRRIVEMYFFEGRTQDEIAADLGIAQQVVSRQLFGAVRDGKKVGGAIRRLQRVIEDLGVEWV